MQYNHLPSSPGIAAYVNQSFEIQFLQTTQNIYFADGLISCIYLKKGGFQVRFNKEIHSYTAPAFLVGIYSRPQVVKPEPDTVVIGTTLIPELLPFLPIMNNEIVASCQNKFIKPDSQHAGFQELVQKLQPQDSSLKCQAIIHEFLERQLQDNPGHLFSQVLDILKCSPGFSIQDSIPADLPHRTIQHVFKEQYGISPKQYLGINRFRHSVRLMKANPERSFNDIAYAAGYYDQSHFIREFRKHTLLTPSEFHQKEVGMGKYFIE